MLHFDTTKSGRPGHHSGLNRVSARLRDAFETKAEELRWEEREQARLQRGDWFLTAELFSEQERPGITAFLQAKPCHCAAIFHDAIPLKHPAITWPQSVARHPGYMKLLASFDRVFAVSQASRDELLGFWKWQGITQVPEVSVIHLGADFDANPRVTTPSPKQERPVLLCLGILEPRKNQELLLRVSQGLWNEGLPFELHVAGRVNPHFGDPVLKHAKALSRQYHCMHFHKAPDDQTLGKLFSRAHALLFPTLAEGCGLPLLEALWRGIPCVCSDLPVLLENASAGGCLPVATNDPQAWTEALRLIIEDEALHARLSQEACTRPLPTWAACAAQIQATLLAR